jgi:hypothetical protein
MKTKICKGCKKDFLLYQKVDGKPKNLSGRSFCLECSPHGQLLKNKKPIINGQRECIRCKTFKDLVEFSLRGPSKHLRSCCVSCETERVTEHGRNLKIKAVQYLGGKCSKCGYNKCMRSLNFHHKDPTQKAFSLAKKKCLKWEDTKAELDKCLLLCANCHGEIHDSNSFLISFSD